jgi:hypothetical protein
MNILQSDVAVPERLFLPDPVELEYSCFLNLPVFAACLGSWALVLTIGARAASLWL